MHLTGLSRWLVLVVLLAGQEVWAAPADPAIESVVAFNTQCARCHEGECSGRMSFQLAEDAADEHIRRYGGDMPPERVRELGKLLRYMKERCAFFPLPLALAADHSWGRDILDRLRGPEGTAYFLPLGVMDAGHYGLRISGLDAGVRACTELVAADFDLVDQDGLAPDGEHQVLRFRVQVPGELSLRIRAQVPITLTRVELVTWAPVGTDPE
jgi:hypothetical protein